MLFFPPVIRRVEDFVSPNFTCLTSKKTIESLDLGFRLWALSSALASRITSLFLDCFYHFDQPDHAGSNYNATLNTMLLYSRDYLLFHIILEFYQPKLTWNPRQGKVRGKYVGKFVKRNVPIRWVEKFGFGQVWILKYEENATSVPNSGCSP